MRSDCGSVLVVDENVSFRAFVADLFSGAGFDVVQCATGEEAVQIAYRNRPDLVILEIRLPDLNGFEVCQRLRSEYGEELPIVFVSADRTEPLDRAAGLLVGGDDYVAKPADPDELLARARRLIARSRRDRMVLSRPLDGSLTTRELEVLRLLAEGRHAKQIASELVISPKTVASHLQHVLAKLGAHSRAEAVAIAYRDGLVGADATTDADEAVMAHVLG